MKLWLLTRKKNRPVYDVYNGHIIRAETPRRARKLAADKSADEGRDTWLSRELSRCVLVTEYGAEEIVLSDFNAG